jgi:hypothetical protein
MSIGIEPGWFVAFRVDGANQAEMQESIEAHLDQFWPRGDTDAWYLRVDVSPYIESTEDRVSRWQADVVAVRAIAGPSGATDHRPASATVA